MEGSLHIPHLRVGYAQRSACLIQTRKRSAGHNGIPSLGLRDPFVSRPSLFAVAYLRIFGLRLSEVASARAQPAERDGRRSRILRCLGVIRKYSAPGMLYVGLPEPGACHVARLTASLSASTGIRLCTTRRRRRSTDGLEQWRVAPSRMTRRMDVLDPVLRIASLSSNSSIALDATPSSCPLSVSS